MKDYWFARFFKSPSQCYVDDGSVGTGGGGDIGDTGSSEGATEDTDPDTGDTGVDGDQGDAGPDDAGDDDNTPRYTKKDVSRMIQGRIKDLEKHKRIVERIAKKAGISVDEVERRLDLIERQNAERQLEETAKQQGIDPRLLKIMADQTRELNKLKIESQLNAMRNDAKNFPGFSEIENEVIDKANQTGLSLNDAYWLVAGPARVYQAAREAEHRTINQRQKLAGKDRVQGDSSSSMGTGSTKIPDEVVKMAKMVGMDPQEYYDSMTSENIDDWREKSARRKK